MASIAQTPAITKQTTAPRRTFFALSSADLLPLVATITVLLVMMVPVFAFEVREQWDHGWHIQYAANWLTNGYPPEPLPHVGYHLLLMSMYRLMPISDIALYALLINFAVYIVLAVWLYRYLLTSITDTPVTAPWVLALFTVSLMLVAPISIFTLANQNAYFGYFASHVYHNPTSLLMKPLGCLQFVFAMQALTGRKTSLGWLLALTAVTVAAVFVKPNYTIALLPPLALVALYRLYKRQPISVFPLGYSALLAGLIMVGQLVAMSTGERGIVFAPFDALGYYDQDNWMLIPKFVLSLAYPLLIYFFYRRESRSSVEFNLAWLIFLFSASHFYFLNETKHPWGGNWWWGSHTALFILFVVATRVFIRAWRTRGDTVAQQLAQLPRLMAICVTLALHVVSGVFWWYAHTQGLPGRVWW
jgi:hypothetical protein